MSSNQAAVISPLLPHEIRERLEILREKLEFLRGSL